MTEHAIDGVAQPDAECGLACRLVGPEFQIRKQKIAGELFGHAQGIEELADGFAFRFPSTAPWPGRALEFIEIERECCPFFRFEIVFEPNGGPLWLRLRGSAAVKAFIRDEIGLATPG